MTEKEFNEMVADFRKEGMSEKDILGGFYQMTVDGKLTVDELRACAAMLGYDLADTMEAQLAEDRKAQAEDIIKSIKEDIDKSRAASKDYMDRFDIIYKAVDSGAISEEQSADLLDYAGLVYVNHLVIEKGDPVFDLAQRTVAEMRTGGAGDAFIIGQALSQYQHGNSDLNFLGVLMNLVGHQFSPVFLQMSPEEKDHASLSDLDQAFPAPQKPKRKRAK